MARSTARTKAARRMLLISSANGSGPATDVPGGGGDAPLRPRRRVVRSFAAGGVAADRPSRKRDGNTALRTNRQTDLPDAGGPSALSRDRPDLRRGRSGDRNGAGAGQRRGGELAGRS